MISPFRDHHEAALRRIGDLEATAADLRHQLDAARSAHPAPKPARASILVGVVVGILSVVAVARGVARPSVGGSPSPVPSSLRPEIENVSLIEPVDNYPFRAKRDLYGVWSDGQETLVIGASGEVTSGHRPISLLRDDAQWRVASVPTKQTLRAVAVGPSAVFAVGDRGTILRRSRVSQQWEAEESGTTHDLLGIATHEGELYAVGRGGTVLHRGAWSDTPWRAEESGTKEDLYGVAAGESSGVYAVGDRGTIVKRTSRRWLAVTSGTNTDLRGAAALGPDAFFVGKHGVILHASSDDEHVVAEESGTRLDLTAIAVREPRPNVEGMVIAVGQRGTVRLRGLRSTRRWAKQGVATEQDLLAVWAFPTVLVGAEGTVIAPSEFAGGAREPL